MKQIRTYQIYPTIPAPLGIPGTPYLIIETNSEDTLGNSRIPRRWNSHSHTAQPRQQAGAVHYGQIPPLMRMQRSLEKKDAELRSALDEIQILRGIPDT